MRWVKTLLAIFRQAATVSPLELANEVLDFIRASIMPVITLIVSERFFGYAVSQVNGSNHTTQLLQLGLVLVAFTFIHYCIYFVVRISRKIFIEKNNLEFNVKLNEKMPKLPLITFSTPNKMDGIERAKECIRRERLPRTVLYVFYLSSSFLSLFLIIARLFKYSRWFIPISLLSILPLIVTRIARGKNLFNLISRQTERKRTLSYYFHLMADKSTAKEVRVLGCGDYLDEKWNTLRKEVHGELWKLEKKDGLVLFACNTVRILGYALSVVVTFFLVLDGRIEVGLLGACIAAFRTLQAQMTEVFRFSDSLMENLRFAQDYFGVLDMPEDEINGVVFEGLSNQISVDSLTFTYPGGLAPVIDGVSMTVRKGERIAVLGVNGSGKSTLVKLLLGLFEKSGGLIHYDNLEVSEIARPSLFNRVSGVQQDLVPYYLTVRENISVSDTKAENEESRINRILESLDLVESIEALGGIDAQLGGEFGGGELSGGQWQKIAIARCLFHDSEILLLDEPTSALDPLIEAEILTNFLNISTGKTTIIVSHRVGLCHQVDRIVLLEAGRVIGIGSHDDLMEKCLKYRDFYSAQEKWYR